MYHINDGLAGSFAFFLGINKQFIPKKLIYKNEKCNTSSIWGPTCASMDYLLNGYSLPEVSILCYHLNNKKFITESKITKSKSLRANH